MSAEVTVKDLRCVFSQEDIQRRVQELGRQIDAMYGQEPLVAVCVLKGAVLFFSDLVRSLQNPKLELDFVRLSSYGNSMNSSKHIVFNKDVETDLRDKHVLIVEDVVDTGHTMHFLLDQFAARKARSLRLAALIDKHERRQDTVKVDFAGFRLEKGFIVGYGLDYAGRYRALPAVYEVITD